MVLNNDNDASREVIESCYRHKKTVLNPIINWEDEDVWEFIHRENIPYCELYDRGYKRLGCIGCPMNTAAAELEAYPKYKQMYLKTFGKMIAEREKAGLLPRSEWFKTPEGVMKWWLMGYADKPIEGQIGMEL